MPAPAESRLDPRPDDAVGFEHGVLPAELEAIRVRRQRVKLEQGPGGPPSAPGPVVDAQRVSAFGVCFSGGGIRSATFNLGILQGLCERGLVPWVDYLSTVSGGGYIGSWLHGLIRHQCEGDPRQAGRFLRPDADGVPGPPDRDPIAFLRKFSNYLAPRPGLFSADTWVMVFIWVRNVLLNQLILVPAIAATAVVALAAVFIKQSPAPLVAEILGARLNVVAAVVGVGGLLAAMRLFAANLGPIARRSVERAHAVSMSGTELRATRQGPQTVACIFVAAIALGAVQFDASVHFVPMAVLAVLMMATILWTGGFVAALRQRHPGLGVLADAQALLMAVAAGLVAAGLVSAAWAAVSGWTPWTQVTFGPPLVCGALLLGAMLLVGLMGADYPDAAREWTARVGAMLAMACTAWAVLFTLLVLAPWKVSAFIGDFEASGTAALVAWLLTSVGGVLAGRSPQTRSGGGAGVSRALEILVAAAPTIFLLGYVTAIAAGVHAALPGGPSVAAAALATAEPPTTPSAVTVTAAPGASVDVSVRPGESMLSAYLAPVEAFAARYPAVLTLRPTTLSLPAATPAAWGQVDWLLVLFIGCLAVAVVASRRININDFSMHHFYKNRLVRCYLGASRNVHRHPHPFTGFDPMDDFPIASLHATTGPDGESASTAYGGPYAIVNTALNLNAGSELAQQERKASSFVFTPAYCGFDPPSSGESREASRDTGEGFDPDGYRPTTGFGGPEGPALGTALGISGAAASPNAGYHTSGPMAFLLTVFNARLGWWVGNPRWRDAAALPGPRFALKYLFAELLGQTTGTSRFVNLSDGGHFENLGLYELVRRRCRFIIVGDGEQDGDLTFGSLGGAIRKCRADFGVEIDINPEPIRLGGDGRSGAHCVVGRIWYKDDEAVFDAGLTDGVYRPASSKSCGWLIYLKSSVTGDEPADVIEYQRSHPTFPHQSTSNQFFTESQFESYRRLGLHVFRSAFEGVPDVVPPVPGSPDVTRQYPLVPVFQAMARKWYAPVPVTAEAASRLADRYVEVMRRLASEAGLAALHGEIERPVASGDTPAPTPELMAMGKDLIQLMQNVFTEFRFEYDFNVANPRNAGWVSVFRQWVASDLLYQRIWPAIRADYNPLFQAFVDKMRKVGRVEDGRRTLDVPPPR